MTQGEHNRGPVCGRWGRWATAPGAERQAHRSEGPVNCWFAPVASQLRRLEEVQTRLAQISAFDATKTARSAVLELIHAGLSFYKVALLGRLRPRLALPSAACRPPAGSVRQCDMA